MKKPKTPIRKPRRPTRNIKPYFISKEMEDLVYTAMLV